MMPIDYDVIVFKEDETCVAYCPELDISSCGNTVEHAKEMLKTAMRLFLEEAEKMGTLDDAGEGRFFKRGSLLAAIFTITMDEGGGIPVADSECAQLKWRH
jgi:predicted RNase H-like HicB family nuclease